MDNPYSVLYPAVYCFNTDATKIYSCTHFTIFACCVFVSCCVFVACLCRVSHVVECSIAFVSKEVNITTNMITQGDNIMPKGKNIITILFI